MLGFGKMTQQGTGTVVSCQISRGGATNKNSRGASTDRFDVILDVTPDSGEPPFRAETHQRFATLRYPNAGDTLKVHCDPKKKEVEIDFTFSERDLQRLIAGTKTLARIYLGGGALRVFPSSYEFLEIASEDDLGLLDERIARPDDLSLGSAHPQGGNAMSEDPGKGVVGMDFRVHGYENLFVADASVFPTNIWANCQATVMAMSHHAAGFVAA